MNKVILTGRLVNNPELNNTNKNKEMCKFTLAVKDDYSNKSIFVPIVAFGSRAKLCSQYLSKGDMALIEGNLQLSSYKDNDNNYKNFTSVIVEKVVFLPKSNKNKNQIDNNTVEENNIDINSNFFPVNYDDIPF